MKKQELNMTLNSVIEKSFSKADAAELKRASEEVRYRYRDEETDRADLRIHTKTEAQGYIAWRYPVTALVIHEVLGRLKERYPEFQPKTVLDLGAGPCVSVMPVISQYPDVEKITLIEEQSAMQEAGRAILKELGPLVPKTLQINELRGSFLTKELQPADLILASYALNELTLEEIQVLSRRIAETAQNVAVLIVPGTPPHFRKLLTARNLLAGSGFRIVAPCTFTGPCHMEDETDWCHFYVRVQRSQLLKKLKSGELAYEDEKFSYLVLARDDTGAVPESSENKGRIIRHPMIRKGRREVTLCQKKGITMIQFTKRKHPEIYKDLRSRGWGDLLDVTKIGSTTDEDSSV